MTPYHSAFDCQFFVGDVLQVCADLAPGSVHTICTSPPYWSLRSYLPVEHPDKALELGSEKLHDCLGWARGETCSQCYICHMRTVAKALWRVLRDDGSLWINCGDSYSGGGGFSATAPSNVASLQKNHTGTKVYEAGNRRPAIGLKPKDRVGIPERLALALQADGWTWRDTIHLCKVAPMPESVRDRTTQAHEPLFLFTKRARYYWDAEAVREPMQPESAARYGYAFGGSKNEHLIATDNQTAVVGRRDPTSGRNPRSWMLWNPEPSNLAHYAAYPRFIPSFAIRAGSSEYGVCAACGAPWTRSADTLSADKFNGIIRERREARGMSRKDLAQAIGKGENNIWDWEQGGHIPLPDDWAKLVTALDLDLARSEFVELAEYITTGSQNGIKRQGSEIDGMVNRPYTERKLRLPSATCWRPTCKHDAPTVPATAFDPFSGSGTTQVVARELGRRSIYCDLSEVYAEMAIKRMEHTTPMLPLTIDRPATLTQVPLLEVPS